MRQGTEVAEGALVLPLRTPTLPPATTTNTLVLGRGTLAVIEPATPYPEERRILDDTLARMRAAGRRVAAILITHHHRDHVGYAAELAEALGVPICAHAATAGRVPFAVDRALADGDVLEVDADTRIEAMFTPGHAPGHLVYLDRRTGVAHGGDMVAGEGTVLVDPDDGGDMREYLESLGRMRGMGASVIVPAHGPVISDPVARIDHYMAHRRARETKIVGAIADGARSFEDVLARSYDDTSVALWPLARRSLEAHLRKLLTDGRIAREKELLYPAST